MLAMVSHTMPLDYGSYLLSSSPPGFGTGTMYNAFGGRFAATLSSLYSTGHNPQSSPTVVRKGTVISNSGTSLKPIITSKPCEYTTRSDIDSINCDVSQSDTTAEAESVCNVDCCHHKTPLRTKKKVSFADSSGFALASVRIMKESSDMPPRLKPELLASLHSSENTDVNIPPLKLGFIQPASDYLKFHEKVNTGNVSLENVILKDYSVLGTVKVKNVAFEKEVFVRFTCDSWLTQVDVPATFSPSGLASSNMFDTFSFELNVPKTVDSSSKIEFCVSYKTNSTEYWDSNGGKNYQILSNSSVLPKDYKKPSCVTDLENVRFWTDVVAWNIIDTTSPYY